MLRESLLLDRVGPCGRQILPRFLREDDHPWLRALLDEHDRMAGRPMRELAQRLAQPFANPGRAARQRLAAHVLMKHIQPEGRAAVPPREARAALFAAAARSRAGRDAILEEVAVSLGITTEQLTEALFADLPSEKRVPPLPWALSPGELALRVNLMLTQALLFRATSVRRATMRSSICPAPMRCSAARSFTVALSQGSSRSCPGQRASAWTRSACCASAGSF